LQYQRLITDGRHDAGKSKLEIETELKKVKKQYNLILKARKKSLDGVSVTNAFDYYKSLESSMVKLKNDKQKLRLEVQTLEKLIHGKSKSLEELPQVLQTFARLNRQIRAVSSLYTNLQSKLQEVEIMEAGTTNNLTIITKGFAAKKPLGLGVVARYATSAMVGLLFALLLLLLKNTLIHTIRSFHEIENQGITVIGEVPIVPYLYRPTTSLASKQLERLVQRIARAAPLLDKYFPQFKSLKESFGLRAKEHSYNLIMVDNPTSTEADIFRYMRLRLKSFVKALRGKVTLGTVILVTSPTEENGKTFVSTNLSTSFGQSDSKTLLIDLDLRNSSVRYASPRSKNQKGIEQILKEKNIEKYIVPITKNYDILFCSEIVEHPTEILESYELKAFIDEQRKHYDYIFLDSPPSMVVCDPSLIAPLADVILLVVAYEITFREDLQLAMDALNAGEDRPFVGVLNLVDRGLERYSYYYYPGRKAA